MIAVCPIILLAIISLPAAVVVLSGAWKMRQLENYPLCMTAAVVAVLPLHAGFVLGLPFGIWALSVLTKPEVKDAFRAKARGRSPG